ncbi:MAG: hypothetical protein ACOYVK_10440 [Bacillota bacterium]
MFNKKSIIIAAIVAIIVIVLTQFTSLKLNNSEEIEVEIRNAIKDYDKPYILKGEQKDKLIGILNDTKLGPYFKEAEILRDSTILIRLYGKGVKNSSSPVYIYYFIHKPNDSIGQINNKLYSVDKKVISQLHDFFKILD